MQLGAEQLPYMLKKCCAAQSPVHHSKIPSVAARSSGTRLSPWAVFPSAQQSCRTSRTLSTSLQVNVCRFPSNAEKGKGSLLSAPRDIFEALEACQPVQGTLENSERLNMRG